jgi:CDP-diacylglycerol--serine O-phosphatidyltransferase
MRDQESRNQKRRLLREQPISRLFPNMITIAGMCCGLSSIRFALAERWELAVTMIIVAALIDGMDGRVARMLGATSVFGAQLDSLSDFLCFGVAPVLVLYMWQLHDVRAFGWAVVLFFAVCTALRLARFNTGLFEEKEPWEKQFFTGVPSPAGGIMCLLPLIFGLQTEMEYTLPPLITACHVLLVGTLMASRIPTYAGKHIRIKHEQVPKFMIGCSFLLVFFIIEPWLFLTIISIVYLISIAFSTRRWQVLKARSKAGLAVDAAQGDEDENED